MLVIVWASGIWSSLGVVNRDGRMKVVVITSIVYDCIHPFDSVTFEAEILS